MMKNITIGQYLNVDSPVHRLDPRAKLYLSLLYMSILFMVNSLPAYIPFLALIVVVVKAAKIPPMKIIRGMRPIVILLSIAFFLNIFVTKGEGVPLLKFYFIEVYTEGIRRAVFMASRLILLISGTSVLTLTTSPIELTEAIESVLSPLKVIKVPAHEIAMMMSIALRFIPTLSEETQKIMKAQMARGADFETGGISARAKAMLPLLVPLFVSAFRRADELAMAMEARCYRGGEGRTKMKIHIYRKRDLYAGLIFAAIIAVAIGIDLWFGHSNLISLAFTLAVTFVSILLGARKK